MLRAHALPLLLLAISSCKGDSAVVGPAGPQGPQGVPGMQGMQGMRGPAGPLVTRNQLPCPSGMVNTGDNCIEAAEDISSAPFALAIARCKGRGRRLCSYSEWYHACKELTAQVSDMANNPELVDQVYPNGD